jgi:hypothetical protein
VTAADVDIGTQLTGLKHPVTGEAFVDVEINSTNNIETGYYLPPSPPERTVTEWDDDGLETERTLSLDEYADALQAHEKAAEEYKRTGGVYVYKGSPSHTTAKLRTATGNTAEAILAGSGEWVFTKVVSGSPCNRSEAAFDLALRRLVVSPT